jgi:parvulin-like peptidyl-prolyl isomerase
MNVLTTRPIPVPSQDARRRHAEHLLRGCLLAAVLVAAAWSMPGRVARAAGPEPAAAPAAPTPAFPAGTVAKVSGMELTRADLAGYAKMANEENFTDAIVASAENAALKPLVEELAITLLVTKQYLRLNKEIENTPLDANLIRTALHDEQVELAQRYASQQVLPNVPEPTKEDVKAYYDKNLDHFIVPLVFSMRQIFVSTYEKVLTKEGETLEDVAKRIAGDEKAVGLILVDNDMKSPRAPGWTPEAPGATKPLEAGEHLLVPMSPEQKKKREARILDARKRLEKGEDFVAVAKKYSDAGAGELIEDLPMTGRPVLPQFIESAKATAPGQLSKVFETKHGYNLIRVESKTEDKPVPLEKVATDIAGLLRSDDRTRTLEKAADALLAQPGVVIHFAALKDMAKSKDQNKRGDIAVMALGDTTVTLAELGTSSLGILTPDTPDAEIVRVLRGHPAVREILFARAARQSGLDKTKDIQLSLAAKVYRDLGKAFEGALTKRIDGQTVTDEEAQTFYDKNAKTLSAPPTCSFYLLAMGVNNTTGSAIMPPEADKALTRLRKLVAPVKTADEFKKVAMENTTIEAARKDGCLVEKAPLNSMPPGISQALTNAEVGTMTEPIYFPPNVLVAWLLERTEGRVPTFDEAKSNITSMIRDKRIGEVFAQVRKEMVEQLGLVMQ